MPFLTLATFFRLRKPRQILNWVLIKTFLVLICEVSTLTLSSIFVSVDILHSPSFPSPILYVQFIVYAKVCAHWSLVFLSQSLSHVSLSSLYSPSLSHLSLSVL